MKVRLSKPSPALAVSVLALVVAVAVLLATRTLGEIERVFGL